MVAAMKGWVASDHHLAARRLAWTIIVVALASGGYVLARLLYDGLTQRQYTEGWMAALLLGMVVVTVVAVALLDMAARGTASADAALASFAITAPFIPSIAMIVTTLLYLKNESWPGERAVLVGLGVTLTLWILFAILARRLVSVDRAHPVVYHEMCERYDHLRSQLASIEHQPLASGVEQSAYAEAKDHMAYVGSALGLPKGRPGAGMVWVSATGYVDLWSRLHRAEEALIQLASPQSAIGTALYDVDRLRNSTIDNSEDIVYRLQQLLERLKGEKTEDARPHWSVDDERIELRQISQAINQFREDRWAGLARARNRLHRTAIFTGATGYALLCLFLINSAERDLILAAAVFYFVGAITGLFGRLMAEADSDEAIEDYGLTSARLFHTPIFCGLAAIGGVLLIAMAGTALSTASTAQLGVRLDKGVEEIFRNVHLADLAVAAIFGLTPHLLINQLQGQAEKYKVDLRKSEPSGTG